MSRELDRLRQKSEAAFQKADNALQQRFEIEDHLQRICDEYWRTTELAGQAGYVLDQIDKDFQEKTKLTKTDIILLFLCTALQCARQYLLTNDKFRFQDDIVDGKKKKSSSQKGDEFMESLYDKTIGQFAPPDWKDVLFQSVPYDAFQKGSHVKYNTGIAGSNHRYRTLGHDPALGWIFGTANIMTSSLITYQFDTYQVKDNVIIRRYPSGAVGMLSKAVEYGHDIKLLGASVARQAIHYGTDFFTKQGLPVPGIMLLNNDLAKDMLSKWHIDTYSVVRGATVAVLINQLISCIHTLFYDESRDGSPKLYEVRTRTILSLSNALATGSNVIVVALTKDVSKLDLGGMLVTIYRLISDYKFIHDVKEDFLKNMMTDKILGSAYSFA